MTVRGCGGLSFSTARMTQALVQRLRGRARVVRWLNRIRGDSLRVVLTVKELESLLDAIEYGAKTGE
jgi:hypothetical protein